MAIACGWAIACGNHSESEFKVKLVQCMLRYMGQLLRTEPSKLLHMDRLQHKQHFHRNYLITHSKTKIEINIRVIPYAAVKKQLINLKQNLLETTALLVANGAATSGAL